MSWPTAAVEVRNLTGWLTTIVARVCLNMLRSRNTQREESLEACIPDPIVSFEGGPDPFTAGRAGDFDALVAVLHPDVVTRADFGPSHASRSTMIRGAAAVAHQARLGVSRAAKVHPAVINGTAGAIITLRGRPFAVMAFTVADDKIVEIDTIGDAGRVAWLIARRRVTTSTVTGLCWRSSQARRCIRAEPFLGDDAFADPAGEPWQYADE